MSLAEITSRNAVLDAIKEYDRIGQSAFLKGYGFGESRMYVLEFEGRQYDSKAIIGVARKYQYPDRPPLRPQDFSGGHATVQRKLESLGFIVRVRSDTEEPADHLLAEEIPFGSELREGSVQQILVNAYERNREAREQCLAHHGRACVICGMTFKDSYGPLASNFIHVHHLRPLSGIKSDYVVDPIADLVPVCPNCHAVVHLGGQTRSLDAVRQLIREAATTTSQFFITEPEQE
ncbi:HNH endonuclease [Zavarzinella formosa]|uniref:HNH endonuclease n=1 Tax=Zavarzinella formosa TaxID=360055 RepID=UPI000907C0BB|nr:HNH endonuclease [Zavarzinella formosa]